MWYIVVFKRPSNGEIRKVIVDSSCLTKYLHALVRHGKQIISYMPIDKKDIEKYLS